MSTAPVSAHGGATVGDLLALPEGERHHEIVDGELVQKAMPSFDHGVAQSWLAAELVRPFHRRTGGSWPGGWWIGTEIEVELSPKHVYRPDIVGWRRDRMPVKPTEMPVTARPDWIAEILSPSNPGTDRVRKLNHYQRFGVPHYWVVDPMEQTLSVYRWVPEGYLLVLAASREERVRAEPFEAVELSLAAMFGADDEAFDDAP